MNMILYLSVGIIFGSISAIFGVKHFAIPAGLLASGFSDEAETANKNCPHCGKEIMGGFLRKLHSKKYYGLPNL